MDGVDMSTEERHEDNGGMSGLVTIPDDSGENSHLKNNVEDTKDKFSQGANNNKGDNSYGNLKGNNSSAENSINGTKNDIEAKLMSLKNELEVLSMDDRCTQLNQLRGNNSPLVIALEVGNNDMIQHFMNECKLVLNDNDLEALLEKAIINENDALVSCMLINGINVGKCLQNCQSVLNKADGYKMKQFLIHLTDTSGELNFSKLLLEDNVHFLHKFVESGADINVKDREGLSCLHRALMDREEKLDVVKYLVEHGADINSVLPSGASCLISAANRHHFKICEYLISKGSDVNCRSPSKKTLLHLVSKKSRFYDTMSVAKVLIRAGADVNAVDDRNLTPIQVAAVEYNQRAVDYFESLDQVKVVSKISAFEIIGSLLSSKDTAIKYWTKALILRINTKSDAGTVDTVTSPLLPGITEFSSIENVRDIAENEERRLFQSVHLLDRNLGRHSLFTLKKLKTLARSYLKTDRGELTGSTVIKYALCKVLQLHKAILKNSARVDALYDILCCWCYYFKDKCSINFADINEIFLNLIGQLDILGNSLILKPETELPTSSLDLVYEVYNILFSLEKTPEEKRKFDDMNDYFIRIESKFSYVFGKSIIHTAVQNRIHYFFPAELGQKYSLTKFLVISGISVNVYDGNRNTPLHLVLKESPNQERRDIATYLLENGAHVDIRNKDGETAMAFIQNYGIEFSEVKYRSLQCLCAVVVKQYQIPFDGVVPAQIKSFIELH